ncbi:MAG: type 1 glutamine amidotransferase [Thermosynechococcaceae cyanobacterium]
MNSTPSSHLHILYLQIRDDAMTRAEELQAFARYSQLTPQQFTILNVFDRPHFAPQSIDGYDALFIGGSSDASVLDPQTYPFVEPAKALLIYCVENSIPVFASCFGFQLVVEALGGKVILDTDRMEMGIYPIELTEAAQTDLLFHDATNGFLAVSGHKERASILPAGVTLLAKTELCPYHALKIDGKPFYGFQFHPEVDHNVLETRISRYRDRYLKTEQHLEEILSNLHPTPEAHSLLYKFVNRVLLRSQATDFN